MRNSARIPVPDHGTAHRRRLDLSGTVMPFLPRRECGMQQTAAGKVFPIPCGFGGIGPFMAREGPWPRRSSSVHAGARTGSGARGRGVTGRRDDAPRLPAPAPARAVRRW